MWSEMWDNDGSVYQKIQDTVIVYNQLSQGLWVQLGLFMGKLKTAKSVLSPRKVSDFGATHLVGDDLQ